MYSKATRSTFCGLSTMVPATASGGSDECDTSSPIIPTTSSSRIGVCPIGVCCTA